MKKLCFLSAILCAAPAFAQSGRQWDAATDNSHLSAPTVAAERVLKRAPLFDNAPFLQLKPGDRLVEGRRWNQAFKGVAGRLDTDFKVFLRSKGRLIDLSSARKNGRLELVDPALSFYFDWPLSLESARQLWKLSEFSHHNVAASRYETIKAAVRAKFPTAIHDEAPLRIAAPSIIGAKTARRAMFEGLIFDPNGRELNKYRLEIGPGTYRVTERFLIVGPPKIDRADFDEAARTELAGLPNSRYYGPLDETKRAAYARGRAFDALMAQLLARESLKK